MSSGVWKPRTRHCSRPAASAAGMVRLGLERLHARQEQDGAVLQGLVDLDVGKDVEQGGDERAQQGFVHEGESHPLNEHAPGRSRARASSKNSRVYR